MRIEIENAEISIGQQHQVAYIRGDATLGADMVEVIVNIRMRITNGELIIEVQKANVMGFYTMHHPPVWQPLLPETGHERA